jgi:hypothetical protein
MIAKILLILFLIASPFMIYGFGKELWLNLNKISFNNLQTFYFFLGIASFFPFHFVASRYFQTIWNYLCTLEHECTHAIVGLLFGKIPVGMRVSAWEGGEVQLRGGTNLWISLAPYFLPTLSLLALLIGWISGLTETHLFYAILGFTISFHLVTNWKETSFRQTDLQRAGYLTSILVLPVANLLFYGAILSFVFGGIKMFASFWINGGKNSFSIVQNFFK